MATFFDFAANYGGAFVPQLAGPIHDAMRRCVFRFANTSTYWLANHCRDMSRMDVLWGLVEDRSVNAFATLYNGQPAIALNTGLVLALKKRIDVALSRPDVLADIGNVEQEQAATYCGLDISADEYGEAMNGGTPWPMPRDPTRSALSQSLLELAVDFAFFHELAHLAHGHVDWLRGKLGVIQFDELSMAAIAGFDGLDRQTLEMDADSSAIASTLSFAYHFRSATPESHALMESEGDLGKKDKATRLCAFALGMLFSLFAADGSLPTFEELLNSTHPEPRVRFGILVATAVAVIDAMNWMTETDFHAAFEMGFSEAARARRAIDGRTIVVNPGDEEVLTRLLERFANSYRRNWARIRPELEPLARAGGLAPAQEIPDDD